MPRSASGASCAKPCPTGTGASRCRSRAYTLDFCSHAARLVVEVDGGQHAVRADHDERRTTFLATQGYRVLRFWNNDVLENAEGVLARISLSLRERDGAAQRRAGEGDEARKKGGFQ